MPDHVSRRAILEGFRQAEASQTKAVVWKENTEEKEVMATQEQRRKERQKSRADLLRLLVFYPLAWIVVSVILFYLVKIY